MNIIIDTDMGADDWLASLLLLPNSEPAVQAITVTGNGLAHLGYGVQHALDLCQYCGQPGIPVGVGTAVPLSGDNVFPDVWRVPTDMFLGIPHVASNVPPSPTGAAALLAQWINQAKTPPVLLALGPLTNVATAFQADSTLAGKLQALYIMGGAVNVPGNVPDSTAEYNFYTDPEAASIVIASGAPITLIPLDATNQAPITMAFYNQLGANQTTPAAKLAFQILTAQLDTVTQGQYFFWDPLAAAAILNPSLITTQTMRLSVMTTGSPVSNYGSLIPDSSAPPIQVATSVNLPALEAFVLKTYNT
ncbi:MAG TPA: nucleoside hydrolase [Candidatus Limnocylindria bacterium]|nr:nucleoside hydrolase [Candidatus Limnocylindria bacterium]